MIQWPVLLTIAHDSLCFQEEFQVLAPFSTLQKAGDKELTVLLAASYDGCSELAQCDRKIFVGVDLPPQLHLYFLFEQGLPLKSDASDQVVRKLLSHARVEYELAEVKFVGKEVHLLEQAAHSVQQKEGLNLPNAGVWVLNCIEVGYKRTNHFLFIKSVLQS